MRAVRKNPSTGTKRATSMFPWAFDEDKGTENGDGVGYGVGYGDGYSDGDFLWEVLSRRNIASKTQFGRFRNSARSNVTNVPRVSGSIEISRRNIYSIQRVTSPAGSKCRRTRSRDGSRVHPSPTLKCSPKRGGDVEATTT